MKRIANKWKVLYFLCLLLYLPLAFGFLMCPFSRYFLFIFIFILRSFTHSLSYSFTSFFVLPFLYLSLSLYSVLIPLARPKFYLVTLKSFKSINMRRTKHHQNDIYLNGEFHSLIHTEWRWWWCELEIYIAHPILHSHTDNSSSPACSNPCASRSHLARAHRDMHSAHANTDDTQKSLNHASSVVKSELNAI